MIRFRTGENQRDPNSGTTSEAASCSLHSCNLSVDSSTRWSMRRSLADADVFAEASNKVTKETKAVDLKWAQLRLNAVMIRQ